MTNRIAVLKPHTATELANALAVAGKRGEALKLLDQVNNPPWKAFSAALVYVGPGEKDEAFRGLERESLICMQVRLVLSKWILDSIARGRTRAFETYRAE